MSKLLQVDFKMPGKIDPSMANKMQELAESINHEPGLIWKIWTQSSESLLGGGIYLFADESSAQQYLSMHSARLKEMGISEIRGVVFDINEPLTAINKGPVK